MRPPTTDAPQVRGVAVDLGPGDTLLVPACWFAHTELRQAPSSEPGGDVGGCRGGGSRRAGSAALLVRLQGAADGGLGGLWAAGRPLSDGALQLQNRIE